MKHLMYAIIWLSFTSHVFGGEDKVKKAKEQAFYDYVAAQIVSAKEPVKQSKRIRRFVGRIR